MSDVPAVAAPVPTAVATPAAPAPIEATQQATPATTTSAPVEKPKPSLVRTGHREHSGTASVTAKGGPGAPVNKPSGQELVSAVAATTAEPVAEQPKQAIQPGVSRAELLAERAKAETERVKYIKALKAAESREADAKRAAAQYEQARSSKDPIEALKALGIAVSPEELAERLVARNAAESAPAEKQADDANAREIAALKAKLEAIENSQKENLTQAQQRAERETLTRFRGSIAEHIDKNAEKYELTKLRGEEGLKIIEEVISADFHARVKELTDLGISSNQAAGEIAKSLMPFDKAADKVEAYYEDQLNAAANSKKWQAKAAKPAVQTPIAVPLPQAAKAEPAEQTPKSEAKPRTIDRSLTARTGVARPKNGKQAPRSMDERIAAALAAAQAAKR